jgi:putative DNA primase/helicase
MQNVASEFRAVGIEPPDEIIADGKVRRFRNQSKKANGWYWLIEKAGKVYGAVGDWKLGIKHKIGALTDDLKPLVRERNDRVETDWVMAKKSAEHQWAHALGKGDSPYLKQKGVEAHGLRFDSGSVLIPMRDAGGELFGVQTIFPSGKKLFTKGCNKQGKFHLIGALDYARVLIICEGYATGATLYRETLCPVAVAFDRTNLMPVAKALRAKFPKAEIVIAADDDRKTSCPRHRATGAYMSPLYRRPDWCRCNPGVTDAMAAARAVGGKVIVPDVSGDDTDFNDMARVTGGMAVFDIFQEAL